MGRVLRLFLATALVAFGFVGATGADPGNKYDSEETSHECSGDGDGEVEEGESSVTLIGPLTLWPPNHKPVDFTVAYEGGSDMDELATEGAHDEMSEDGEGNLTEENGTGNTDPATDVDPPMDTDTGMDDDDGDGENETETHHALRAERSGHGVNEGDTHGRDYTIAYEVTDAGGATICMGTFTVNVPHDQRGGAGWK